MAPAHRARVLRHAPPRGSAPKTRSSGTVPCRAGKPTLRRHHPVAAPPGGRERRGTGGAFRSMLVALCSLARPRAVSLVLRAALLRRRCCRWRCVSLKAALGGRRRAHRAARQRRSGPGARVNSSPLLGVAARLSPAPAGPMF
jgi:hypothetical protein